MKKLLSDTHGSVGSFSLKLFEKSVNVTTHVSIHLSSLSSKLLHLLSHYHLGAICSRRNKEEEKK